MASFLLEKFEDVASVRRPEVEWHQRTITLDDSTRAPGWTTKSEGPSVPGCSSATTSSPSAPARRSRRPLLTACHKKNRLWDTSMTTVRGRIELDDEELAASSSSGSGSAK